MINENLTKYLDLHSIQYETNVSLKKRTWIHRGGIAELFITPVNAEELEKVVSFLYSQSIKFQLIGHTSNLYILNSCNIPVVVSTSKCRNYSLENGLLYCETGVGVISLSKQMIKHGINGFEYLTGLPGTIGAAIVNNSSCRDNSIAQLLVSAKVIMKDGSVRTFFPQDFNFKFRMSVFKKHEVDGTIISAILKAEIGDANKLQKIAEDNDKDRAIRLEGHAKNLGCTVNRCFINGNMSLWLRIALFINGLLVKPFIKTEEAQRNQRRNLICLLTGYRAIAPYVSSKNPIIFSWLDDRADTVFPLYLEFMKKVYKTDKIEIEIIR